MSSSTVFTNVHIALHQCELRMLAHEMSMRDKVDKGEWGTFRTTVQWRKAMLSVHRALHVEDNCPDFIDVSKLRKAEIKVRSLSVKMSKWLMFILENELIEKEEAARLDAAQKKRLRNLANAMDALGRRVKK